mmetsp:Transcript_80216/g.214314  ORF Transcript_80216/g.214314 Transcript_80216/m.214314 type:complete len:252 (-) Transcript_80216:212-967(-)
MEIQYDMSIESNGKIILERTLESQCSLAGPRRSSPSNEGLFHSAERKFIPCVSFSPLIELSLSKLKGDPPLVQHRRGPTVGTRQPREIYRNLRELEAVAPAQGPSKVVASPSGRYRDRRVAPHLARVYRVENPSHGPVTPADQDSHVAHGAEVHQRRLRLRLQAQVADVGVREQLTQLVEQQETKPTAAAGVHESHDVGASVLRNLGVLLGKPRLQRSVRRVQHKALGHDVGPRRLHAPCRSLLLPRESDH